MSESSYYECCENYGTHKRGCKGVTPAPETPQAALERLELDMREEARVRGGSKGEQLCAHFLVGFANRLAALRASEGPQPGTFACPICGTEGIHAHGDADIFNWLDAQASRFGYRLTRQSWAVSREEDSQLPNEIEHCIRRLKEQDMALLAQTPMGRMIQRTLAASLPIARAEQRASSIAFLSQLEAERRQGTAADA